MASVFNILPNAAAQDQAQIIYAEVSDRQPLPAAFTDSLYVVQPDWSADYYFTIPAGRWKAEHGQTLPAAGAACLLVKDPRDNLWCVGWDGLYT